MLLSSANEAMENLYIDKPIHFYVIPHFLTDLILVLEVMGGGGFFNTRCL